MAQTRVIRSSISDGLFWGLMCVVMAGTLGGAFAFIFATNYDAGWISGGAFGAVVFLIAAYILTRSANATNLPPPNTLKAPVAPPGGAFQAPKGRGRATAGTGSSEPAPPQSFADMSQSAGEAVGKAAYSASAAVTSAAQAARDAISGVVDSASDMMDTGKSNDAKKVDPAPAEPVTLAVAVDQPMVESTRPMALDAPREGGADDLKRIKGVGPKLEELLNSLGFYHLDQIAAWGPEEVAWIDANLEGFSGRATRDDWVAQAAVLAAGGDTEFSQRVDKGDIY